jgi:rifampin ADP-ribosylating transferase
MAEVTYYHGTKSELENGTLISPGYRSNYGSRKHAALVYLSKTLIKLSKNANLHPLKNSIYYEYYF